MTKKDKVTSSYVLVEGGFDENLLVEFADYEGDAKDKRMVIGVLPPDKRPATRVALTKADWESLQRVARKEGWS